jgi:hypothetical protein
MGFYPVAAGVASTVNHVSRCTKKHVYDVRTCGLCQSQGVQVALIDNNRAFACRKCASEKGYLFCNYFGVWQEAAQDD